MCRWGLTLSLCLILFFPSASSSSQFERKPNTNVLQTDLSTSVASVQCGPLKRHLVFDWTGAQFFRVSFQWSFH